MAKGDKHVGAQDVQGNKEQKSEIAVTGAKLDLRKKNGTITVSYTHLTLPTTSRV